MVVMSTTMFAQAGATWVGANFNYGMHKDYKNFGLGAKVQYEFIDNVRAEASFDYFFKKDYMTQWDINLNAHYVVRAGDKFSFYPLAGLTILNSKLEGFDSKSKFGFNAGAGVEYQITESVKLNLEGKYQYVKNYDRPVISMGVAFAL